MGLGTDMKTQQDFGCSIVLGHAVTGWLHLATGFSDFRDA